LLQERCQDDGDILSATVLAYGEAVGKLTPQTRHWVEKTPFNERYAAQIFAWWPEARCVHMLRDPRDNYASFFRKHPNSSPAVFASTWRESARAGLRNQRKYGSDRYLLLRYEDFARDPETAISQLCAFLGIEDNAALRNPTRGGKPWQGNSMFPDRFSSISAAPVGRWRELLSPSDRFVLETLCASFMRSLHYEPTKKAANDIPISFRLRTYKTLLMINLKENI
jgi:hypothetical protein